MTLLSGLILERNESERGDAKCTCALAMGMRQKETDSFSPPRK